jgi:hypothetical protein
MATPSPPPRSWLVLTTPGSEPGVRLGRLGWTGKEVALFLRGRAVFALPGQVPRFFHGGHFPGGGPALRRLSRADAERALRRCGRADGDVEHEQGIVVSV